MLIKIPSHCPADEYVNLVDCVNLSHVGKITIVPGWSDDTNYLVQFTLRDETIEWPFRTENEAKKFLADCVRLFNGDK